MAVCARTTAAVGPPYSRATRAARFYGVAVRASAIKDPTTTPKHYWAAKSRPSSVQQVWACEVDRFTKRSTPMLCSVLGVALPHLERNAASIHGATVRRITPPMVATPRAGSRLANVGQLGHVPVGDVATVCENLHER